MIRLNQGLTLSLLALLALPPGVHAQAPQFGIDLNDLDRQKSAPAAKPEAKPEKKKAQKRKKEAARTAGEAPAKKGEYLTYIVKPGDHLLKILVGRLGMSSERAEKLVPDVIRINDISNIRNLQVGQKLLIPAGDHQRVAKSAKKEEQQKPQPAQAAAVPEKVKPVSKPAAPAPAAAPEAPKAPAPVPVAPKAPVASAPMAPPMAPLPKATVPVQAPVAPTWVCSIPQKDPGAVVDSILNALSVTWCRNRVLQSAHGASIAFSIRVDRYFDYRGGHYIVSIGEGDAYGYTLMKLLEDAGYKVLKLGALEDFNSVTEKLLSLMGVAPDFGNHELQGGKQMTGFLVPQEDGGGRRVIITSQPADRDQKWVMVNGCSAR